MPLTTFEKGQRKDDVMAAHLVRFTAPEGILFVGRAQEKARVVRTEKRRNPLTGQPYPWLVRSTAMVNHFYFYGGGRPRHGHRRASHSITSVTASLKVASTPVADSAITRNS